MKKATASAESRERSRIVSWSIECIVLIRGGQEPLDSEQLRNGECPPFDAMQPLERTIPNEGFIFCRRRNLHQPWNELCVGKQLLHFVVSGIESSSDHVHSIQVGGLQLSTRA